MIRAEPIQFYCERKFQRDIIERECLSPLMHVYPPRRRSYSTEPLFTEYIYIAQERERDKETNQLHAFAHQKQTDAIPAVNHL